MRRKCRQATAYGIWIKKRLLDKNMTVCQLADAVGVTQPMISMIIYGDTPGNQRRDAINAILREDTKKAS